MKLKLSKLKIIAMCFFFYQSYIADEIRPFLIFRLTRKVILIRMPRNVALNSKDLDMFSCIIDMVLIIAFNYLNFYYLFL